MLAHRPRQEGKSMDARKLRFEEDREQPKAQTFTERTTIPCPRCRDRAHEKAGGGHICFACGWEGE